MKQRVHRRAWRSTGRAGHRPRVLIEDDHPALAISDLSMFKQAGFDVAFCSGPGRDLAACPLFVWPTVSHPGRCRRRTSRS